MPEYTHTLIPDRVDFAPDPEQVGAFLGSLVTLGAAPLKPTITASKLSGKVSTIKNHFTGETVSIPMRKATTLKDVAAVPGALKGLDDFTVTLAGKGPPKLPAFVFDFQGQYDFLVHCCFREEVVSTSDWHDEVPIKRKVQFFGRPCSSKDRLGIYHNPHTLEIIEVPKAGCARFWIEFEYGKMLFPPIVDRLDLIEPKIVTAAEKEFAVKFVQGCRWGAWGTTNGRSSGGHPEIARHEVLAAHILGSRERTVKAWPSHEKGPLRVARSGPGEWRQQNIN